MSSVQKLDSVYVDYELESVVIYENESVLQNIGEYVLSPQDLGKNLNTNEHQTPKRSHPRVIQDEYDDEHYTLARPNNCPTERYGVLQNATFETKPTRKDGMFKKKSVRVAAVAIVCLIIVGGVLPLAIVLTPHTDYIMVCPDKFTAMNGHAPGRGLTGRYESSLPKCANDCNARMDCNGFEHSKTRHQCRLVEQKVPTAPMHEDFQFCRKVGGNYLEYLKTI